MKKTLLTLALVSAAFAATNAQAAYSTVVLDGPDATLKAKASAKIKGDFDATFGSSKADKHAIEERSIERNKSFGFEYKVGFEYEKALSSFTTVNIEFDYEGKYKVKRSFSAETTNGKYPHPQNLTTQKTSGDLLAPAWGDYTFTLTDTRYGKFTFSNDIKTVFSKKTKVSLNPGVEELKYGRGVQYQSPEFYGFTVFASYNNTNARVNTPAYNHALAQKGKQAKSYDIKALRVKYALPDVSVVTGQEINLSYLLAHSHLAALPTKNGKVVDAAVQDIDGKYSIIYDFASANGVVTANGHADNVRRTGSYQSVELNYLANIQDVKLTAAYAFASTKTSYNNAIKGNENALFFSAKYKFHQYVTLTGDYGFRRTNLTEKVDTKYIANENVFKVSYGSSSLPLAYGTSVEFGLGYEYSTTSYTQKFKGKKLDGKSTENSNKFTANVTLNLL